MADWVVDPVSGPRTFPRVRHRHANGTLDAVRDPTPTRLEPLGEGERRERWTYACPCGDVYVHERRVT